MVRRQHGGRVNFIERALLIAQPLSVGGLLRQFALQLFVVDDPALFNVDQEYAPGL